MHVRRDVCRRRKACLRRHGLTGRVIPTPVSQGCRAPKGEQPVEDVVPGGPAAPRGRGRLGVGPASDESGTTTLPPGPVPLADLRVRCGSSARAWPGTRGWCGGRLSRWPLLTIPSRRARCPPLGRSAPLRLLFRPRQTSPAPRPWAEAGHGCPADPGADDSDESCAAD